MNHSGTFLEVYCNALLSLFSQLMAVGPHGDRGALVPSRVTVGSGPAHATVPSLSHSSAGTTVLESVG